MPKINQEEYEILKEKSSGGYEWIARDESGSCFVFELKPIKDNRYELWEWVGNTNIGKIFNSSLFQFIQWEDSEPYNIQELIEEYEHESFKEAWVKQPVQIDTFNFDESEETEVKSIQDLIDKWDNYKNVARTVANSRAIEHADMFINDLNQLDEPEVLSDKWIDEHKYFENDKVGEDAVVKARDLRNLLVPKQEEMKVSKTWHDVIAQNKEEGHSLRWTLNYIDNLNVNDVDDFAKAWLAYPNIEVEEEQKYIISINITDKDSKTNYETFLNKRGIFHSMENDSFNSEEFNWSEEEIKDLENGEILFEHFAVPVEELEE